MKNEDQRWILNIKYEGKRFITTDSLLWPQINKVLKFWDMEILTGMLNNGSDWTTVVLEYI